MAIVSQRVWLPVKTKANGMAVCERYALLPNDKKQMIAGELDRSVREIERKISVSPLCTSVFIIDANLIKGYADSCGVLTARVVEKN